METTNMFFSEKIKSIFEIIFSLRKKFLSKKSFVFENKISFSKKLIFLRKGFRIGKNF